MPTVPPPPQLLQHGLVMNKLCCLARELEEIGTGACSPTPPPPVGTRFIILSDPGTFSFCALHWGLGLSFLTSHSLIIPCSIFLFASMNPQPSILLVFSQLGGPAAGRKKGMGKLVTFQERVCLGFYAWEKSLPFRYLFPSPTGLHSKRSPASSGQSTQTYLQIKEGCRCGIHLWVVDNIFIGFTICINLQLYINIYFGKYSYN